jgi:hypothetical protein
MALQSLLLRAGHPASLRIGVAKDAAGGLEAHAWVECEGKTLQRDGVEKTRFAPLLDPRSE